MGKGTSMLRAFLEQAGGQPVAALAGQLSALSVNGNARNGDATAAAVEQTAVSAPAEFTEALQVSWPSKPFAKL